MFLALTEETYLNVRQHPSGLARDGKQCGLIADADASAPSSSAT